MHSIVVCFFSFPSSSSFFSFFFFFASSMPAFVLTMQDKNHVQMHSRQRREQQQQQQQQKPAEHNKSYNELPLFTDSIFSFFLHLIDCKRMNWSLFGLFCPFAPFLCYCSIYALSIYKSYFIYQLIEIDGVNVCSPFLTNIRMQTEGKKGKKKRQFKK